MTEPAPSEAKKAVAPRTKPMTITERKMLLQVIDNDFKVLGNEVNLYATELKNQHMERIKEEYRDAERQIVEAENELVALQRRLRQEYEEFIVTKRNSGLSVRTSYRSIEFNTVNFSVEARESALSQVDNDVNREVNKVRMELERKRLELHRTALLSGLVSKEAKDLLDSQPDPREMLADALQENPRFAVIQQAAVQAIEGRHPVVVEHDNTVHIAEVVTNE